MSTLARSFLNGYSAFMQVKKGKHKSLNEFEFLPDPITNH